MKARRVPLSSLPGGGEDRLLARARHPTSRGRPDPARMTARLADRLAAQGHPWPDFAAALIAERARSGLDRSSFASTLGVGVDLVAGIETGRLAEPVAPLGFGADLVAGIETGRLAEAAARRVAPPLP